MRKLESDFLRTWLAERRHSPDIPKNISVYDERADTRTMVWNTLCLTVADHFYDLSHIQIIKNLGEYPKAFEKVRRALPRAERIRSGDLAEILASEYVSQLTDYFVPIRKLRYKDDRDLAMRGDDVIAIGNLTRSPPKILKGEAKSRQALTPSVVKEACETLMHHQGRPNPSTLAFIARRLDDKNEDTLASIFHRLQEETPSNRNIKHLIFTLSANDPLRALTEDLSSVPSEIDRQLVGVIVADHQDFIREVFESI
jgi:hypothetical protein